MKYLPILLFCAACRSDNFYLVECQENDTDYFAHSISWMNQYRYDIQDNLLWEDPVLTVDELIVTVNATDVFCGIQDKKLDEKIAGERLDQDSIVINIQSQNYFYYQNLFIENRWSAEYISQDNLEFYEEISSSYLSYISALSYVGGTIAHENAHILLGNHSCEANRQIKEQNGKVFLDKPVDEIYAWGDAVVLTALLFDE